VIAKLELHHVNMLNIILDDVIQMPLFLDDNSSFFKTQEFLHLVYVSVEVVHRVYKCQPLELP
jgi:hypothetical protein